MQHTQLIRLGAVSGMLGMLTYLGVAVGVEQLAWQTVDLSTPDRFLAITGAHPFVGLTIGSHLALGVSMLLQVVAFVGLYHLLSNQTARASVMTGTIFGIIASGIMVVQMTVQGTVMARMGQAYLDAPSDAERHDVVTIYKALRLVDQGIDLAFDTFFFAAWILLAFAMVSSRHFGNVFGYLGVLLFGITVVVNSWSAPMPPSFDVGPVAALWVLAVYVQMCRSSRSAPAA